jgi:hypothetical protein
MQFRNNDTIRQIEFAEVMINKLSEQNVTCMAYNYQ